MLEVLIKQSGQDSALVQLNAISEENKNLKEELFKCQDE
eukprot:CAMPEP_0202969116 /NCGR_PEP_ID=MMETSP1396-20130829/14742_1 /ASSEMBLY_ACC=CAM_ASM_000872 /TAXON_ID= /ORGANISM="Pseudokeronopsis sp., Strain Brazil" /LENGTH=38 /DNA_ID= /DNA_START= /DNA_END= /DNA_ORIENTATION=